MLMSSAVRLLWVYGDRSASAHAVRMAQIKDFLQKSVARTISIFIGATYSGAPPTPASHASFNVESPRTVQRHGVAKRERRPTRTLGHGTERRSTCVPFFK